MTETQDDLPALQQDIARRMGRCILRLQKYEVGLKGLIAAHKTSANLADPEHKPDKRREAVDRMTLGQLVGALTGSYLQAEGTETAETPGRDAPGITIMFSVEMPGDALERLSLDLQELVDLRNGLVHHFSQQHDLASGEGCKRAIQALTAAEDRIGHHQRHLRDMVTNFQQLREQLSAEMQSGGALEEAIVYGILPDGVDWQFAPIVGALIMAAEQGSVDGWARVTEAGVWVAAHHPDLSPERYGCASWRQVLHESRRFDLRYGVENGRRVAWYRAKSHPAEPEPERSRPHPARA